MSHLTLWPSSEDELQPELQPAHLGAGRIDGAEGHAVERRVGISPVRMVQEVERLETELDVIGAVDMEILRRGEVPVHDTGPNHLAAAGSAERAVRRPGVRGRVEPLADRRIVDGRVGVEITIRSAAVADVGGVFAGPDRQRESRPDRDNRGDLPAPNHLAQRSFAQVLPVGSDRQVVHH